MKFWLKTPASPTTPILDTLKILDDSRYRIAPAVNAGLSVLSPKAFGRMDALCQARDAFAH